MRAVVIALAVAACAEPSMQYAEYLTALRDANCERLARCGAVPDVATCIATSAPIQVDADVVAASDAGKLEFHADLARACLDLVETLTCDRSSAEFRRPKCEGIITGTLADDAPCALASECISGECWVESGVTCDEAGCCRGMCAGNTPSLSEPVGGRCRYNPCIDAHCSASTCVAFQAEGEACDYRGDDFGRETCGYGLGCNGAKCVAMVATGEPCEDKLCANVADRCALRSGVCEPRGFIGGECLSDVDCAAIYHCSESTYRCVDRPRSATLATLPLGAACKYIGGPTCAGGAFCDADLRAGSIDGFCTLPKPVGASCIYDTQCASASCSLESKCIETTCI